MADRKPRSPLVQFGLFAGEMIVFFLVLRTVTTWETSALRLHLLDARQRLHDSWSWVIDRERFKRTMAETLDSIETTEES